MDFIDFRELIYTIKIHWRGAVAFLGSFQETALAWMIIVIKYSLSFETLQQVYPVSLGTQAQGSLIV